ncbi:uncharacterized protein PRCAT00005771001 [Priceomyces carsonii]|uniref:uncharacterized protein n=1 Tax=Priceomyces carsonii TaxID=28549 RepID=UPI002EDA17BF|nr:unnamed protein product [Priceomyces carsonii]
MTIENACDLRLKTKSGKPLKIGTGTGTKWKWLKFDRSDGQDGQLTEELVDQIVLSLQYGYRHIDTAEVYTTHPEIGAAVKRCKVNRDDIFITSKFNGGIDEAPRTSENPIDALEKALEELDTDYIDLFLIHQPFFDEREDDLTIEDVWKQMVELKRKGKARYIGVSNFAVPHMKKIFGAFNSEDRPVVNQIEFHPYLQEQSPGIIEFCKENNILIEAYAPLAPLFRVTKNGNEIKDHPLPKVLDSMVQKYRKTDAQILLRYCLEKDVVPITTSSKPSRINESLAVYEFKLDPEDVSTLDSVGSEFPFRAFFEHSYDHLYN